MTNDAAAEDAIDEAEDGPVPEEGRIALVLTSPRVAVGLLGWHAWSVLRSADAVFAADLDPAWQEALAEAGVVAEDLIAEPVARRAGQLVAGADGGRLVAWFGSPDGDPGLTDALAEHLSRRAIQGSPPEIEVITGSHDIEGARLLDLVSVMDQLRSPGGCPWDAEQTHTSLLPYLLEETHEVMEAIEAGDRGHLREELGDLLLQVVFHARVAQEDPQDPFGVDEVAGGIVEKLVRRHPHVFAGAHVETADDVEHVWEQAKAAEKGRTGVQEGIPAGLPALARTQKLLDRLERAGRLRDGWLEEAAGGDAVLADLLAAVRAARTVGVDAEATLRAAGARLAVLE